MATGQGIRAGKAFVELFADDTRLVRGLRQAQQRLQAFGTAVRDIGKKVVAAGAAMVAPFLAATAKFAATGSALDDLSQRTGVSAQALSELAHAAEMSDASVESLGGALFRMRRRIANAATGGGPAVRAMRELGLSAEELTQLPVEAQFMALVGALEGVENESLRAQYAFEVLGDGAKSLLPLLAQGADGINALRQQARELGITLTDEDAAAAAEFSDAWDILKKSLGAIVTQIGAAVAPILTDLAAKVTSVVTKVVHWITANRKWVAMAFHVAAAVMAAGIALVALGAVIAIISAAFGALAGIVVAFGKVLTFIIAAVKLLMAPMVILQAVMAGLTKAFFVLVAAMKLLMSPIVLIIGGFAALIGYMVYASGVGGKAIQWLGQRFADLAATAQTALQGIGDAIATVDLALAAKILWLTLKMEWQRGVAMLNEVWATVRDFFLSVWTEAVYDSARNATNAWAGLQTGWVHTVDFLRDAWSVFTTWVVKAWHVASGLIQKAWVKLKSLFDSELDADAEIRRINEEVAGKTQATDAERDRIIGERDQARQRRLGEIESGRTGALDQLDQMREEEHAARRRSTEADLAASEKALQKARNEWDAAIVEAAQKRKAANTAGEPEQLKSFRSQLGNLTGLLDDISSERVNVQGTFSAFGVRGLGTGSPMERTAKAAEATAKNTKQIAQHVKDSGERFA